MGRAGAPAFFIGAARDLFLGKVGSNAGLSTKGQIGRICTHKQGFLLRIPFEIGENGGGLSIKHDLAPIYRYNI